jgi:MFS transporter, SP family, general alpha glucoside:H+ symporter
MNPTALNMRGYTGFVWGGGATAIFIWAWFRLPETKGRTFEELDVLFADKVTARKFKSTQVNAFDTTQTSALKNIYAH